MGNPTVPIVWWKDTGKCADVLKSLVAWAAHACQVSVVWQLLHLGFEDWQLASTVVGHV